MARCLEGHSKVNTGVFQPRTFPSPTGACSGYATSTATATRGAVSKSGFEWPVAVFFPQVTKSCLRHSPHFPIQRLDNSCETATGLIQVLVTSFQAAAERVLRAEETHGGGRRGGAGVGLGRAAGYRGAPQPAAHALSPRPVLGGPSGGGQGAAARRSARAPGRRAGAQHQGPLEKGHGLGAAGDCGHGNRGASAVFPP